MPVVPMTDNDRRVRSASQWAGQITMDTDPPSGVYSVRRARVSPCRVVIGVEGDLEVAAPRSDTVVERVLIPNREQSFGRPKVERRGLRERAAGKIAQ